MLETPLYPLVHFESMSECENPRGADNQQERSILNPEYLAGLIVGEGSYFIGIRRQNKKSDGYETITMYPGFSLRMNDVDTIDLMEASFGALGIPVYRSPAVYKRCHSLNIQGIALMRAHLDVFLPLLVGNKRRAAQIVSDFTDRRLDPELRNRRYDEDDLVLLEQLREVNGPSRVRLSIEILRDYMLRPNGRETKTAVGKI
jgi:hypothetical protein